ncbi:hypothetical protein [Aeromonas hydrophila]|uniref:hypothetical protein n=1 Tax=Aeromonas hydrophila TaxID=644 RepID=UPI000A67CC77|nr:hypothetical protein [Aeromonas hydrophila]
MGWLGADIAAGKNIIHVINNARRLLSAVAIFPLLRAGYERRAATANNNVQV